MSFAEKKGIAVASGFKLQAQAPIDARFTVDTLAERDELVTIKAAYEGLDVFVKEDGKKYMWDGTQWKENTTGAAYTHPTTPGYKHIPAGGTAGQVLKNSGDGAAQWADEKSYSKATASADGLMSKEHYSKVEGVAEGAQVNVIEQITVKGKAVTPNGKTVDLEVLVASDLANYYSKPEIDQKVSAIPKFAIAVVDALPTSEISDTTVYLVKSGDEESNLYTEYIYAGGKWEILGTQTVDLSNYVTKANAISGAKAKDAKTITFTRADGTTFDITITGTTYDVATASANGLMSKEDKAKLDGVAEGANNYQHPANHPASMITEDATHRFATDEEKESWNKKANVYFANDLPTSAPSGAVCFLIG